MPFDSKILLNRVKRLRDNLQRINFADVFVGALNTGNALMQRRIFNDNRDTEGNSFGTYIGQKKLPSPRQRAKLLSTKNRTTLVRIQRNINKLLTPYQRKRANAGRQVIRKDLELFGELRRSIEVQVLDERAAALMFNNDKSVLVARGQENQITNIRNGLPGYVTGEGIPIFRLNEDEKTNVNDQVNLIIRKELTK